MDQREWDYGARLPRDRRAAESWSLDSGPESAESGDNPPKWQSITDTGSLEPSPEAVAWSLRADQWAQQPNLPERQQGQWDGQVSRWSEVVPTGNSPAEGVGWRTETAEWRATSARWRQTTEWRSTSGTHGWRSTTEAWQTGDANAEGFPPPAAPPTGGPLAISGTAWSGDTADAQSSGTQESWQQSDGSYRTESYTPPSAAGQSPPTDSRPSWQAFAVPTPPWQQPAPAPPWQQTGGTSWQQAAPSPPPWEQRPRTGGSWQQLVGPDDGRHLVRDDDRAQWRQSAAGAARLPDQDDPTRQIGRRRAPEGGGARPGGGTGWSTRSDADNWAGHTDTGSMPMFQDLAPPAGTAWPDRTETPSWRTEGRAAAETPDWRSRADTSSWRDTDTPGPRRDTDNPGRTEAPDWRARTDTPSRSDTPSWRREDDSRSRRTDGESPDWRTRREDPDVPDWRSQTSTSSWRTADPDAPDWRAEGRAGAEAPSWRDEPRARAVAPDRRRDPERDDYRGEPDSGSWSRDDEPRTDGWRRSETPSRRRDPEDWRRDEPASDPWAPTSADTGVIPMSWQPPATDTGSWRTPAPEAEPYSPPRRREYDPDGRRTEIERFTAPYGRRAEIEAGPYAPSRRRAEIEPEDEDEDEDWDDEDPAPGGPIGPEVWRQDPEPRRERENWRMEPLDDARTQSWRQELREEQGLLADEAATEIRTPIDWQQAERDEAARGAASYREGNTGDWRLELAAETGLADGESRRYGTSDFVPFAPSGAGAAGTATVPAPRPAAGDEMVVGNRTGTGRWQDPPDTQWPPRPATGYDSVATGSYERRPVSTLPTATGQQSSLLEPDDDEIEESNGGPLAAVGYTVIWYGVPVVLFVLYMLVLNGSQQAHALSTLAGAAPQFGLSLVLSMLVAVGLRWASGSWKAASVGLAAAVMGGGLATVLTSAITGNSLS